MSNDPAVVKLFTEIRDGLIANLADLQSGRFEMRDRHQGTDVTPSYIEKTKRQIAEIDALLAGLPKAAAV